MLQRIFALVMLLLPVLGHANTYICDLEGTMHSR